MASRQLWLAMILVLLLAVRGWGARGGWVATVRGAGDGAPVCVEVPSKTPVQVKSLESGKLLPCQCEGLSGKLRVTWIGEGMKRGVASRFLIIPTKPAKDPGGVELRRVKGAVEVLIGGKLFTRYETENTPRPYCFPVIGPTGTGVTRSFPMEKVAGEPTDHPHHRSLWFAFGSVNGQDLWTDGPKAGRIVHRAFEKIESGPVMGRLCARNDWLDASGRKLCEDRRELRFYRTDSGRLLDFEITLRATDGPVVLGDTKEGMMAVRVAAPMQQSGGQGRILNARGDAGDKAWGKRAEWCDYSGPGETGSAEKVGILAFDLPGSFRRPTYWMVRGYGLFAANPFGVRDFTGDKRRDGGHTIPAGGSITFRYRFWIHPGELAPARAAEFVEAGATPPVVEVRPR